MRIFVLGVIVLSSCSAGGNQPGERMVDIGTHSLHAVVLGTGSPAVVIDGGIGERSGEYRALQDTIAAATTVVTYDRAGYIPSEAGPLPRNSQREAEELRALLAELKIPRPYILVGHSLGGLNAQVYASLYPEDVAGMVLLDPPPLPFLLGEDFTELGPMAAQMIEEWQGIAESGIHSENGEERANAEFFLMLASEQRESFGGGSKLASSISSFGDIPLIVIASGVPNPMMGDVAEAFQRFWAAESESLATKSSSGQFVLAETSTHRLHADAEDLVAERILSMLDSLRQ
jgi:pimeloyl-ACP methyl ester carboxylesterase